MSLWLSGANAWAGAARSAWSAEAGHQRAVATRRMMELWAPPAPGAKQKRTRRKAR